MVIFYITLKQCSKKDRCANPLGSWLPATTEYFYWRKKRASEGLIGECKCCVKARSKKWAEENPARLLDNVRRYQTEHPEETREKKQRYYERNKAQVKERARLWNRAHPEVIREIAKNSYGVRRARKCANGGKFTRADIALIKQAQTDKAGNLHCWYCGDVITQYHVDHKTPLSRGGSNAPENLCLACKSCNLLKGSKTPSEWNGRLL